MNSQTGRAAKAAFEITKGAQHVMTLSEADVERYLDLGELLDGLEDGFRGLELGQVQSDRSVSHPRRRCLVSMVQPRPGRRKRHRPL
jgi:hypothetical protein